MHNEGRRVQLVVNTKVLFSIFRNDIMLLIRLSFFLVLLSYFGLAQASPPSVLFLNPGDQDDAFFGLMESFMQAAADDLGMNLEVIYCHRDHYEMMEKGQEVLNRQVLPDYLILINEKNAGIELLEKVSKAGVKVVLINEGLQQSDKDRLGRPGERLSNWLFELLPNDKQAGYLLGKALIEEALGKGAFSSEKPLQIVGIAGTHSTGSSSLRVEGFEQAVSEYENVVLRQVVPGYWEEEKAERITHGLLDRYPEVTVVWCASDLMAQGALRAAREVGRKPGRTFFTGGIDWAGFSFPRVTSGDFVATVGGHFFDGGWAMVMLYDYHNEVVLTDVERMSEFSIVTIENVGKYQQLLQSDHWERIEFHQFSKHHDNGIMNYHFELKPEMLGN